MKKLAIAGIILFLSSVCFAKVDARKVELQKLLPGVSTTAYLKLANMPKALDRKAAMVTMSQDDRLAVWKLNIAYALAHFKYTDEERILVQGSQRFLTKKYFDGSTLIDKDFADAIRDEFVLKAAEKHLLLYMDTFEVPGNITASDHKLCGKVVNAAYVKGEPYRPCTCFWSIWCEYEGLGNTCGTYGGVHCNVAALCGVFGDEQCTGTCYTTP